MTTLAWAIPVGVFIAAFIVNMIRWPHTVYKEERDNLLKRIKKLEEK